MSVQISLEVIEWRTGGHLQSLDVERPYWPGPGGREGGRESVDGNRAMSVDSGTRAFDVPGHAPICCRDGDISSDGRSCIEGTLTTVFQELCKSRRRSLSSEERGGIGPSSFGRAA